MELMLFHDIDGYDGLGYRYLLIVITMVIVYLVGLLLFYRDSIAYHCCHQNRVVWSCGRAIDAIIYTYETTLFDEQTMNHVIHPMVASTIARIFIVHIQLPPSSSSLLGSES